MIERYSRPEMAAIWSESSKYERWLQIEILVCEARAELGLMPRDAAERIRKKASFHLESIREIEKRTQHDVIAFISNVGESLDEDACYFHEGLTSSDILDTALALQLLDATRILQKDIDRIIALLADLALKYEFTPIIGRTHGIHAEPLSFGQKIAVFYSDFLRCSKRLAVAMDEVATGKLSGAVGNFAHLSPQVEEIVCRRLELTPEPVSTQIVQRDRHAAYMTCLGIIAACCENISTEIRHLQRTELREAEEPFGQGQRGSSAMPHKKNPVLCENICGLARLIRGHVVTALENITLWHERDISHSAAERVIFPDATIALDFMLVRLGNILEGLTIFPDHMAVNLDKTHGVIYSQKVLLALTSKGLSRETAYPLVQKHAMNCWQTGTSLKDNLKQDPQIMDVLTPDEVDGLFDITPYLRHCDYIFRRIGLKK